MQTQLHNVQMHIKGHGDPETTRMLVKLSAFLDTTEF